MRLLDNPLYLEDLNYIATLPLPWEQLEGRSIMISGATGMIGSFLIDALQFRNRECGGSTTVYALGRSKEKAEKRFAGYFASDFFHFIRCDINKPVSADMPAADYILHLASNTHPLAYANDPIGTVTANVFGTYNLLEYAVAHETKRFALASSNEVYGENRGDVEFFDEDYCGYINSNTLRAGYPESKRCAEALCQAYSRQRGVDIVIPRLTRSYGPTLLKSDTKAMSQFLHKALSGEDIVLKSEGTQYYSYTYTADAVAGLLTVLLKGESGHAYNIADMPGDIMLKDLAALIAGYAGKQVVFELPDESEAAGYSKATKARLGGEKLKGLGWQMHYDMAAGIERTLKMLSEEDIS